MTRSTRRDSIEYADVATPAGTRPVFRAVSRRALAASAAVAAIVAVAALPLGAAAAGLSDDDPESTAVAAAALTQTLDVGDRPDPIEVDRDGFSVTQLETVQWPLNPATFTGGWGPRSCAGCSSFHMGMDLNEPVGTPIHSISDGVVVGVDTIDWSLGHHLVIEHQVKGQTVYSIYAHMGYGTSPVGVGDTVQTGDVVGRVGLTGQTTGAHLHFALATQPMGGMFDPMPWMLTHVTENWRG